LYRGNHQSRPFERLLRERGIPYHLSGGNSFFDYAEVKDIMAYLRLLANPDDDNAFLRIVNVPRREIGPSTIEKLAEYAGMRGVSLFEASFELGLGQHLGERSLARLQEFANWIIRMAELSKSEPPAAVVRILIQDIDYSGWLETTCRDERQAERRMKNVLELVGWIERLAEREEGEAKLSELTARLTLMDILEQKEEEDPGDRVALMTLHAAKGLEFPHVFLVGMEENLLPHRTSIEEGSIEEERRLCYVGITRAQKTLTLSLTEKRKRYGETEICEPSRFLLELPQEDLRWEGRGQTDPETRKETGRNHLADLRKMLGGA
jgi:ATP-dependent DNA helicase Rep